MQKYSPWVRPIQHSVWRVPAVPFRHSNNKLLTKLLPLSLTLRGTLRCCSWLLLLPRLLLLLILMPRHCTLLCVSIFDHVDVMHKRHVLTVESWRNWILILRVYRAKLNKPVSAARGLVFAEVCSSVWLVGIKQCWQRRLSETGLCVNVFWTAVTGCLIELSSARFCPYIDRQTNLILDLRWFFWCGIGRGWRAKLTRRRGQCLRHHVRVVFCASSDHRKQL
jgi:hypothetical protein